jgi:uncharacterized Rmd1/YagE family protein
MASSATETSPLIPPAPIRSTNAISKSQKNVTFNPEPSIAPQVPRLSPLRPAPISNPTFPSPNNQPMLSALNSKLRRRNSHGSPLSNPPLTPATASKIGPQRTTKNAQKLKILPNPDPGENGPDEESGRDVYSQFTRIKDPTARRDAARLGKADRDRLPRVTAYCTANAYRMDSLMKFLKGRTKTRRTNPKQFDECIYSPFDYNKSKSERRSSIGSNNGKDDSNGLIPTSERDRRKSDSAIEVDGNMQTRREELIDLTTPAGETAIDLAESSSPVADRQRLEIENPDFDTQVHVPEVFLFEYGTVVIWGMSLAQEQRFLKDISKFETEKLSDEDVQIEDFNFYYTREYQARIYNDFISLREKRNYMTKLAISHALSQSVKVCSSFGYYLYTNKLDFSLRGPSINNYLLNNSPYCSAGH